MKKFLIVTVAIVLAASGIAFWPKLSNRTEPIACTQDAKLCSDGSSVGRTGPKCEFAPCPKEDLIRIESPRPNERVTSPIIITGEARGYWFFEASFPVKLYGETGDLIAQHYATAKGEWMTENFVPFEVSLPFTVDREQAGTLVLEKDNPSGLPEHADEIRVPVMLASPENARAVKLFYYNPDLDRDVSGNIQCSREGIAAVQRQIPLTRTPIQDAIRLLLAGALTNEERAQGISTEYPLAGFSLTSASLKDGTLTLAFDDPNHATSGGACRAGILWFQIEATAKQFPEVRQVRFLPEELFQP